MARDAVDRPIQHAVTIVNIIRRERALEDDALLNILKARSALQLVQNHLAIGGEHLRPVMLRAQKGRVHEHI